MLRLRIFLSALLILFSGKLLALEAGETVRLHGHINKDTYAAGGSVFSSANIAGDLMASGGTLIIDGSIQSDLMLVGGDVTVSARIGDDLRIMAGSTLLKSTIGGDLLFAGDLTGFIILLSGLGAGSRVLYRKYQSQNI